MNIVLLILDALRYDHVNNKITPNLMKIAKESTFFRNAFSCNSSTRASIPCILCSNTKYDTERNIATILNNHGVHTAMIHSNPLIQSYYSGFKETFDIKSSKFRLSKDWRKKLRKKIPAPVIAGLKQIRANIADDDKYLPYARAGETIEFALDWMKNHDNFFLWMHIMDPHIPYYPMKTSLDISQKEMRTINDHLTESVHGNYSLNKEETEIVKTLYKEDIHEMDQQLKVFFKDFENNDLLIITSDHGEEFNEYGQFSHHENKIIPELIHIPLIFHGLRASKGKLVEEYVSTLSIAPSILEALKIDEKIGFDNSIWKYVVT
jgi:arylsulfatase A-like enzyme